VYAEFARSPLLRFPTGDQSESHHKFDDRPLLAGGIHSATSVHTRARTTTVIVEIKLAIFNDRCVVFSEYSDRSEPL
jgi:hypothetical protein